MKIFDKGLLLPPPFTFYIHWRSSIRVYSNDDDDGDDDDAGDDDDDDDDDDYDDDDVLPVVVAVPGKAQAFAVYIHVYI